MLFILPLKLFSFSRYFNFYLEFLAMQQNGLIRKVRLIPNFMTSQTVQQTIGIHILTNISRSKGNEAMKFCQLIEYNMRNTFLEKSYKKVSGETIPRPFSKKSISPNQQSEVLQSLFLLYMKLRLSKYKLSCRPLSYTSYKAFLKNKMKSGNCLFASFSA